MPLPSQDGSPTEPKQPLSTPAASVILPKSRHATPTIGGLLGSPSPSNLVLRKPSPSSAVLYASTLSPPGSRPMSPTAHSSPLRSVSETTPESTSRQTLMESAARNPEEPLNLILRSFVPHVSVFPSKDTEILIGGKGFRNGLWELLRPFGENIKGKMTVRDSNGVGQTLEDFSIRFTRFGSNIGHPDPSVSNSSQDPTMQSQRGGHESHLRDRKLLADVEAVVERHLSFAEQLSSPLPHFESPPSHWQIPETSSPYYSLYLRRLLSGLPITAHETFSHPVACVIAISSKNEAPIEELRALYTETNRIGTKLPPWVDSTYLRYYVLIHDEENDDITRSMALFEQMKRHLGLHCHLLRLRCSQSVETDDDSMPMPRSDWISATEELEEIRRSESDEEFEDPSHYIFESDVTAIRAFVYEMVTQSIIPTMERHISVWNDQVASRRRGIAGRFMNLSRKWTGLGSSSRSSTGGSSNSKDNYDTAGFYQAESPEAIMRKLGDYAFMLRDWKLARSTYDMLRTDFSESKAWKYHAAANEMAAISLMLMPRSLRSKNLSETVDQLLEASVYSYGTQSNSPYGAMRCLILGFELLRLSGVSHIDDAGGWGLRLLESRILGGVGDALIKERLSICYGLTAGVGSFGWGRRLRKSATWAVLAADAWCQQTKYIPAQRCLAKAQITYESLPQTQGISKFSSAIEYIASLQHELADKLPAHGDNADEEGDLGGETMKGKIDEESEALMDMRARRASVATRNSVLETAPLHGELEHGAEALINQGGFG
ncbi:cis-Golgi transport protein particle complex subunit [Drechmeria coniospora]|uniref:Cis-Golgi transport protein particle complex subunit n=1 Tax=Drechmeria coniospora TaxID=98403 RepID=A0A151GBP7_DRECN|nr:cis-Golgi transport protein particle complex subunit [Drechmeria coniospora]KYK54527.1 cis-Golgi transport protein particle complex subunit [Drechmeria coniospora]